VVCLGRRFTLITCFMRTEMDYLVVGNYIFEKKEQPKWREERYWRDEYGLD